MKRIAGVCLAGVLSFGIGAILSQVSSVQANPQPRSRKIAICHGTASAKNPYVLIHVDANAVKGHFDGTAPGHGKNNYPDFYARNGSCDTSSMGPS